MNCSVVLGLMVSLMLLSCNKESADSSLFTRLDNKSIGIDFDNMLPYDEAFNTYTYRNFYNGGGVALGDINNDGLTDIYFTGNIDDNKLYLNKGDWKFEDITQSGGVACPNVWSTGACMVDLNGDGLLDIYVCKAGKPGGNNRHNELFINQGDLTFKESAKEYGLDVIGLSIHAAFFDYDKDGDLDCYILNNSLRSVGGFDFIKDKRLEPDAEGNRLMRNDGGKFVNVSTEAGIFSSNIGYGLGITLADFNMDQWPDIFISNDFFERDYLYINNQDGTFSEEGEHYFQSMSMGSMGADACDLNNDLLPDLFVTEMLPQTLDRKKTKAQYENWDKYHTAVKNGYYHQYSRNILQKNMGQGKFLEVSRLAGVAATEWSWASLLQDFDNDGLKDMFISNGIYKDLLDKDYLNYFANENQIAKRIQNKEQVLKTLIDSMPSQPVVNAMYRNMGQFQFEHVSDMWGLGEASFSNGSAYGDLDNDGDLDLVVNNANMQAMVYRNNTDTATHRSIRLKLIGEGLNTQALGSKVVAISQGKKMMLEHWTSKGFQSSVDGLLLLGLGNVQSVDTLAVLWPDGKVSMSYNLPTNARYTFKQSEGEEGSNAIFYPLEKPIQSLSEFDYKHDDLEMNLFVKERLTMVMNGYTGPALAVGDVNGDGTEDVFIGGGKSQSSALYISNGTTYQKVMTPFEDDAKSEVVDVLFEDLDQDGDLDIYVAHGGYTFSSYSLELYDILYENNGRGTFTKKNNFTKFPYGINTAGITTLDLNKDGHMDIIIGEHIQKATFGKGGGIHFLINNGDLTFSYHQPPSLKEIGMITDVASLDTDLDGDEELVLVGQWMTITTIKSNMGSWDQPSINQLDNSSGMWNTLHLVDINADGNKDLVAGNEGLNNFYKVGTRMYVNDFDQNGSTEQIVCERIGDAYYPIHDLDELYSQLPMLKKKFTQYESFSKANIEQMFGKEVLDGSQIYEIDELKTCYFLVTRGGLEKVPLPYEVQQSCVNAINSIKTRDGNALLLGGNHYRIKPQFGRQDGSLGWSLKIDSNGEVKDVQSLFVDGMIRDITLLNGKVLFGINNEHVKILNSKNE